jgi:hypothetical protein
VYGSPVLVSRMVENVIENAICHNVDGGWIGVTTTEDATTASCAVMVL